MGFLIRINIRGHPFNVVAEVSLSNGLGLAIKVFINNTKVIKFGS